MQNKALITLSAALTVVAVLMTLTAAMPVASKDKTSAGDMSDLVAMAMPKAVMMTVSADGMTGGNMTFTVPYAAKVYRMDNKEMAAVATYDRPLKGTCNVSTGRGTISIADALPATATVDYANKTSIPVAGSSAVVVMQDFNLTGVAKETGTYDFQFGKLSVYLPDGTVKSIKLDRPVMMSLSVDEMKLTTVADPAVAKTMANLFSAGTTFPAGAQPVKLDDILAAI
jgi:hypothetical protein